MNKKIVLVFVIICFTSYFLPRVFAQNLETTYSEAIIEESTVEENLFESNETLNKVNEHYYEEINAETKYHLIIDDTANLLTDAQIKDLAKEMNHLTQYGNILFKSTNENSQTVEKYAHDYYYEKFGSKSGTLFLIDMAHRYLYIHSDGENYHYITKAKADTITDNVYRYATNGDYYTCALQVYEQAEKVITGERISEPMKYTSNALISLICGFFISFMFIWSNSRIKSATPADILKNCKIKYKVGDISGVQTGQRRVYSPQSDGGSSGFSSGGHGSGGGGHSSHGSHSSGGGGGHGF